MISRAQYLFLLGVICTPLVGGCALNELARKQDIAVAKTDLSEEILKIQKENRALSERLDATTQQIEDLTEQIHTVKSQSSDSARFVQQKLQDLNASVSEAKNDQQKISTDFAGKIQVVLDEVSKENTQLRQQIDKLGEAPPKKSSKKKSAAAPGNQGTYTVAPGDSLAKIAKRNGTTVAKLMELNSLSNANNVQVGQKLVLPAEEKSSQ